MIAALTIIRVLHILSAALLIGGAVFNYFLVRPTLRFIPPAHAVVVGQKVGDVFMYMGWVTLVLLGITGGLRLFLLNNLWALFTLEYYETGSGRAVLLMIVSWLVAVGSATAMTFLLRPVLMSKLSVQGNPDLAGVERRRAAQMAASQWLERLQLINIIFTVLAALGGASALYGGIF